MSEIELLDMKRDALEMKGELASGKTTSGNCTIVLKRIMRLNDAIDRNRMFVPQIDMIECCYGYYRMLDQYFY